MRYLASLLLLILSGFPARADDADAYQKAVESVVRIRCSGSQATQYGTGVVINSGGYILTAAHTLLPKSYVYAYLPARDKDGAIIGEPEYYGRAGETTLFCRIVGVDEKLDLALLKFDSHNSGFKPIKMAKRGVTPGTPVFGIGNGLHVYWRYFGGRIKQVYHYEFKPENWKPVVGRFIDSSAMAAPGDSGGPLLNEAAELVGINIAVEDDTGTTKSVDISEIRRFVAGLEDKMKSIDEFDAQFGAKP